MWLIWLGVALIVLKVLELGEFFANLSWWWITVPFVIAFLWFELVERRLGMDKKKAFNEIDDIKKLRIKRALEADKARARGRQL
jgi:small Trp-rich protein